jgi:hypothetical protein
MAHIEDTLYDLCEKVEGELAELNKKTKGSMSAGDLEVMDKLTHTLKSIKTTLAMIEADGGYSGEYSGNYGDGGGSYARGRGRNARRDSMGRYSSEDGYSRRGSYDDGSDVKTKLQTMMGQMPDRQTRNALKEVIDMM